MQNKSDYIQQQSPNGENTPQRGRKWTYDDEGRIEGFTLTALRTDLLHRLKIDDLYTLEDCKILLKEIMKIVKADAEKDLRCLMFLTKLRTEHLYPKKIITNYIPEGALDGFVTDTPEEKRMIYGKTEIQKDEDDSDDEISAFKPKAKLNAIVIQINKAIIKIIDMALKQRKERLLLAATILSELEGIEALKPK